MALPFHKNRTAPVDPAWRLPLQADEHIGVVTPSCEQRGPVHVIPARAGIGLRIGGEASLCFTCGPDGGVYHPSSNVPDNGADFDPEAGTWQYGMAEVLAVAERLSKETNR